MSDHTEHDIKLNAELRLKDMFPPVGYDEWKAVVEKDLKGVPFEKKLITKTYEGIDLQPIYTSKDTAGLPGLNTFPGFAHFIRGTKPGGYLGASWDICQEIPSGLAEEYNEALRYDLQRGLNAVLLPLDLATQLGLDADYAKVHEVGYGGISISALNSIARALNGVDLTRFPLYVEAGFSSLPMLVILMGYLKKQIIHPAVLRGSIESDPLSFAVRYGEVPALSLLYDEMAWTLHWVLKNKINIRTIAVNTLPYHNAGASAVQELGYAMATGAEYMHQMMERGLTATAAAQHIRFSFGIGTFYFMEIAKLRAARLVWSSLLEAFGVPAESRHICIRAKTGLYNQTVYDPYVNLLRITTEAFSAVVGGADSITTSGFDEAQSLPDEFARRLARNTQIILNEEAHLRELIDPAGGSYFVEKLTQDVAQNAWDIFRNIEEAGGMSAALIKGIPQNETGQTAARRAADLAKRKSVLVGTNMYANPKEEKLAARQPDYDKIFIKRSEYLQKYRVSGSADKDAVIMQKLEQMANAGDETIIDHALEAVLQGATLGEITKALRSHTTETYRIAPLKPVRLSEPFEILRDRAEAFQQKTGAKPKVFLATMGPLSQFKARADFSRGFFETGGFEVIYPNGFETANDAAEAAVQSGAGAVAICSTDETYPELVPPLVAAIKSRNPNVKIILAGYPKDQIEAHKKAGVNDFIFLGADAVEILSRLQSELGVR